MFVKPRKAATAAVLKDCSGKMEVLLMRRHLDDRFLPDYFVFPGGALDEQDYDYEFSESSRAHELKDFKGDSKKYYGYIICAIRETFEESGLLIAADKNGNYPSISSRESIEKFSAYRKLVFEKKLSFRDMLEKENLYPAVEKFFYMNRWITPPLFPIRYDTRFFAAVVPEDQEISHDGNELVEFQWMAPDDALEKYRKNEIKLVMPTIRTLEFLSRFKTSSEVISHYSIS